MTNSKATLTSKTGNIVTISSATDSRVSDVVSSDGMALVTARSRTARDELASEYTSFGCNVDACDSRGLKVW